MIYSKLFKDDEEENFLSIDIAQFQSYRDSLKPKLDMDGVYRSSTACCMIPASKLLLSKQ